MHERCPLDVMPDGTVLYIAEVGDSTVPHQGIDLSDEPRTAMIRIQWLFGADGGCYPPPSLQAGFIQRVESLVRNTPDCHTWIGGNEPNIKTEGLFMPEHAAGMYNAIWRAVHAQPGHEDDVVLLPPVGPWNTEIGYGWIEYFARLTEACDDIDGFALHTYSRGPEPSSVWSEDKMNAPYDHLYNGFRTYRDWMAAIPERYRDRPVHITETDQNEAWLNELSTWVQTAYAEINDWNKTPGNQQIRSLILYRWPPYDKYSIEGKQHVIDDFKLAQTHGYEWTEEDQPVTTIIDGLDEYYYYNDDGHLTCPVNWVPVWLHNAEEGVLDRPEFKQAGADQTRTPPGAAAIHGAYSTLNGALRRSFNVGKGEGVRAGVYVRKEAEEGFSAIQIGIDPTGQGVINDERIQWSEWYSAGSLDWKPMAWRLREVETIAQGNVITVFLRSQNDNPVRSHAHFDDFTLVTSGVVPPDPPEPPTGTWRTVTYDPAGNVAGEHTFEGPSVNPQICTHAQAIMELTCP